MRWISDEDLKAWSRRTDAREIFVDLVGDLIRATVADTRKFRFPGQSAGTLRGFDGDLETTEAVSRVPAGHSKWEFGTSPTGKSKAQSDYDKRTTNTPADVMAENAFVMLNLHSWDTPRDVLVNWLSERRAERKWREIYYIDGTALASWLEEKPAVAARYARKILDKAPRSGALSTDEFWERYSSSFKPALTEQMLLCEREREAAELLQVLNGGPQNFTLAADSAEEVIAFAVAVIRTAPGELRKMIESRTMVVESFEAAEFLQGMKEMNFLVWKNAEQLAGSLGRRGATLTAATGVQRKRQGVPVLERPTASAMAEAMMSMGIDRQDGYDLAFKCGRSLTILRRLRPAAGIAPPAQWEHLAASLKPALLAGGWSADSELDKEVVASLAGETSYVAVEALVRQTLNMSDPPFDRVEQVWQVRAAVDAFPHFGHLVDEIDLQRLKATAIRVFGHQVVLPTAEERFSFDYRAPADYSYWLRDGLAYTLMLFAVMPDVGGLQLSGTTPQRYVDDVIRSLPGFAKGHRWILPILSQLSIIAEAAPTPFLDAIETILEGQAGNARGLFDESDENDYVFSRTSPHVYVLWALEVLAWNPTFLHRVTVVLGKLAAIDPALGSAKGNRPLSSLRNIFLPWSPNTDADLNRRLVAIDGLICTVPAVAWELLLLLMPRAHDSSSPSVQPKLRDTAPFQSEQITSGLVWYTEELVLNRVILLSQEDEQRVIALVEHLANLQFNNRARLLAVFADNLLRYSNPEGSHLWHTLREYAARHEEFPDAEWSLKGEEMGHIKKLLDQHRPTDVVAQARYLFDDWVPNIGLDANSVEQDADTMRTLELRRVYAELGVNGLLRLAKAVNSPYRMGLTFDSIDLPYNDAANLIFALMDIGGECYSLACMISGGLKRRDGPAWASYFRSFIVPRRNSSKDIAWLLANWVNDADTRAFIKSLGQEVADHYWREVGALPRNASSEELLEVIAELRRVDRSLKVINSLHRRVDDLSSKMLLCLLDESVNEIASGTGPSTMVSYVLNEVFSTLAERKDVTTLEVAMREYIYLPLIKDSVKGLSIHALLSTNPDEYVDIIKSAFVSEDAEEELAPNETDRAKSKLSYSLLKSFHLIPGENGGVIDEATLQAWVAKVRSLAAENRRGAIADEFVGQLLAHSTPDLVTDTWPPHAVAAVLEQVKSEIMERGIEVERFNMRGSFSKAHNEGGGQEWDLASRYRRWAAKATSPRTAAMLERIAEGWSEYANREDIAAQQRKLKR